MNSNGKHVEVEPEDDLLGVLELELREVVETNRVGWLSEADGAIETARVDEAAALTAYLEAATSSTIARQVRHWLQHFPEKGSRVRVCRSRSDMSAGSIRSHGAMSCTGSPYAPASQRHLRAR